MPRTFRLAVLLGLFVLAGLAFPSVADAQRHGGSRGGGGGHGAATARAGGPAGHGGGVNGGSHVAVPRAYPRYSYYSRPYYSRPYYSSYYPHYYSQGSFSLSFGFRGTEATPRRSMPIRTIRLRTHPRTPRIRILTRRHIRMRPQTRHSRSTRLQFLRTGTTTRRRHPRAALTRQRCELRFVGTTEESSAPCRFA